MVLTLLLIIIYLSFISLGLPDSLLGSAWPSMYQKMGVPISYAGIISMIVSGGTIISSFLSERVIRRLKTGKTVVISVMLTAIALFGFSVSNNFIFLCLLAIPMGLGGGSVDAALNNYIALHYKAKHMSWLHCFWGIGATAGPIIMATCLQSSASWRLGYRIIAIIQFSLLAILIIALPLWNKVKEESSLTEEDKKAPMSFKNVLKLPGAKPALIAFFCYCAIEGTAGLWGSSFLVIIKGIEKETAAAWISLYYFGITFGRFLSGFLTMKFSNRQMIRIGLSVLTLGVVFLFMPFGNVTLVSGFFLIGLGCAPIYPSLLHETPVNFGKENSKALIGIQMGCAYIGATFMPPFFGLLAQHISYSLMPVFLGVILLLLITMVERVNRIIKVGDR